MQSTQALGPRRSTNLPGPRLGDSVCDFVVAVSNPLDVIPADPEVTATAGGIDRRPNADRTILVFVHLPARLVSEHQIECDHPTTATWTGESEPLWTTSVAYQHQLAGLYCGFWVAG